MQPNRNAVQVFTKTKLDLHFSFHLTVEKSLTVKKTKQAIVYKYFSAFIDLKCRN